MERITNQFVKKLISGYNFRTHVVVNTTGGKDYSTGGGGVSKCLRVLG